MENYTFCWKIVATQIKSDESRTSSFSLHYSLGTVWFYSHASKVILDLRYMFKFDSGNKFEKSRTSLAE